MDDCYGENLLHEVNQEYEDEDGNVKMMDPKNLSNLPPFDEKLYSPRNSLNSPMISPPSHPIEPILPPPPPPQNYQHEQINLVKTPNFEMLYPFNTGINIPLYSPFDFSTENNELFSNIINKRERCVMSKNLFVFFCDIWMSMIPEEYSTKLVKFWNGQKAQYRFTSKYFADKLQIPQNELNILNVKEFMKNHPACSFFAYKYFYKLKIQVDKDILIPTTFRGVDAFLKSRWKLLFPTLYLNGNWIPEEIIIYNNQNLNCKFIYTEIQNVHQERGIILNINFCEKQKIREFCDNNRNRIYGSFCYTLGKSSPPKRKNCNYICKPHKHFINQQKLSKSKINGWLLMSRK